jgi:hypothetical protein
MTIYKVAVDDNTVIEMTVADMIMDKMSVGKMSIDEMTYAPKLKISKLGWRSSSKCFF